MCSPNTWKPAPGNPLLTADEVHVYRFHLVLDGASIARMAALLDRDENARLEHLRFEHDRRRFIARRGCLRLILARYLRLPAAALTYSLGEHGRPHLAAGNLEFNASHSSTMGLVAVSRCAPIGVDIERIRPGVEYVHISHRFFSTAEQTQLSRLPFEQQSAAFFRGWTRKEAYLKALGTGLLVPLGSFDVSLLPDQPARLLATRDGLPGPEQHTLIDLQPGEGYAAALCLPVGEWKIKQWDETLN